MKIRTTLLIVLLSLLRLSLTAQTTVVAKPVSDSRGMAAFQITRIVRVEGKWDKQPLEIGQLLYTQVREKAHPLGRFGEAVVITFMESDNPYNWQGVYVHNGYIPALNGIALNELIKPLESKPLPPKTEVPSATRYSQAVGICPICHERHLHI